MITSTIISGLVQVLVFVLVPFLVYVATARRRVRFAEYIGIRRATVKAVGYGVLLGVVSFPLMFGMLSLAGAGELLADPASQTGRLREVAASAGVATMLFIAVFQAVVTTALSEEMLFRGFLAKRLIAWLGFGVGNTLQAIVFGAIHGFLFMGASTGLPIIGWLAVVLLPSVQGWAMGWLNERIGNGSIIPGWCAHAVTNVLTFAIVPLVL